VPKKTNALPPAPIVGPLTEFEWMERTNAAIRAPNPSDADRAEYRRMLALHPTISRDYGELARHWESVMLESYASQPLIYESVVHRLKTMRRELAGDNPTPLEVLLIEVVLAAYADYWGVAFTAKQQTNKTFTLNAMEQWEKILASKEARYLRAIETVARVRRLLKLPGLQVNVNLPGGQQVNMQGGG